MDQRVIVKEAKLEDRNKTARTNLMRQSRE